MTIRKIDFDKVEDFDELCELLNLLGFEFDGDEEHKNYEALQPYLGEEVVPEKIELSDEQT